MNAVLLAFSLLCVSTTSYQDADRARFVSDGANSSFKDGVFDLREGGGWLRFPRLFTDFRLAFDFRPTTHDTDPGVIVRSWPDWIGSPAKGYRGWPHKGYRFGLPTSARSDTSSVFVGRGEEVVIVQEGRINLRPPDEWQHVEVTAEGRRLTLRLNGTVAGVYEVESFAGYILFENRKGGVHLRNIGITTIERNAEWQENLMTFTQPRNAGGQPPKLVREVKPTYTADAIGRKVQGTVKLEVVVLPDGSTVPVRITRSLEPDLDLSAAVAAKGWTFKPGMLNGKPVPVVARSGDVIYTEIDRPIPATRFCRFVSMKVPRGLIAHCYEVHSPGCVENEDVENLHRVIARWRQVNQRAQAPSVWFLSTLLDDTDRKSSTHRGDVARPSQVFGGREFVFRQWRTSPLRVRWSRHLPSETPVFVNKGTLGVRIQAQLEPSPG